MKGFGRYLIFLHAVLTNRETFRVYMDRTFTEAISIGINSLPIVSIVATFIGAVTCVQTAFNLVSPFIPVYIISNVVRDMTLLELAPTITCVVLAGKVGSHIAGELGTMKINEQVDALEVMGVNAASFLVLPKILASLIMIPLLCILSAFLSIMGGYIAAMMTGIMSKYEYQYGLQYEFIEFTVPFSLIKSIVFAFLISSISSYNGYITKGGALEVGKSSTRAVTNSCIAILIADFVLAKILL